MSELWVQGAIVTALVLGSVRALDLWRCHSRVDAVNAVVVSVLGRGRADELGLVLSRSGSGLYLKVVEQIVEPRAKFQGDDLQASRQRLERDARQALTVAARRLRRLGWIDVMVVVAIAYSGISSLLSGPTSWVSSLGLVAATLLWWSNVRAARSLATQHHAGAMALIDTLLAHDWADPVESDALG